MSNNYQRLFYILKNMDSEVGYPTGYIKVEINCEVAKIQISLNNLLIRQGILYQLYGIKKLNDNMIYTVICNVPNVNGRADVKINTDINRIGSNSLKLEDINVFAIIAQIPNRAPIIKCPLVAYTKGELLWKQELETLLLKKEQSLQNSEEKSEVLMNEAEKDKGKDILAGVVLLEDAKNETKVSGDAENEEAKVTEESLSEGTGVSEETLNDDEKVIGNTLCEETKASENTQDTAAENEAKEIFECQDQFEQEIDIEQDIQTINTEELPYTNKFGISSKFESALTNIYNIEKSTANEQEKMPDQTLVENDILSSAQKNFMDISSIEMDGAVKTEFNMLSLKEELDKSFEDYNPFKTKSKSIKWWKINSPGLLNNILFRNNVKSYLLFNPKVMLAHYKYRYIIFGIRNDKHFGKEYFVCGVPGVYSIDENPFEGMGSWAQLEGYKPKYGAFGYWVVFIDPRTGKLLNIK